MSFLSILIFLTQSQDAINQLNVTSEILANDMLHVLIVDKMFSKCSNLEDFDQVRAILQSKTRLLASTDCETLKDLTNNHSLRSLIVGPESFEADSIVGKKSRALFDVIIEMKVFKNNYFGFGIEFVSL